MSEEVDGWVDSFSASRERLMAVLFGDRVGFAIFLGAILFLSMTWRVGVFINDNHTLVNTLTALEDGRLHFGEFGAESAPGISPGTHVVDGKLYGRNYGQVVIALPLLLGLRGLSTVVDPQVLIVGLASLILLVFAKQLGTILDRRRSFVIGGCVLSLLFFVANLFFARPIGSRWFGLIALQVSTMLAAAMIGVLLYRIGTRYYGTRTGVFAGAITILATPVAFWATMPKRHTVVALLVILVLYCLLRSRDAEGDRATAFHSMAYIWVGLTAWVSAPDALILLAALGVVDLASIRSWFDDRRAGIVAMAFGLSLLPFLLTNFLISGQPLRPPRMLPNRPNDPGSSGNLNGTADDMGLTGLAAAGLDRLAIFGSLLYRGIVVIFEGDRVYHTFLRSGFIDEISSGSRLHSINLTVLESMPLAGVVVAAIPIAAFERTSGRRWITLDLRKPRHAADLFVIAHSVLLVFVYLPKMPAHASITARYLHPLFPLAVYGAIRLQPVRAVIDDQWKEFWWSYGAFVLVGGQLLVGGFAVIRPTLGEGVQFFAELSVASAMFLTAWAALSYLKDDTLSVGAYALAFTAGLSTVFLLFSAWLFFQYSNQYPIPVARVIAGELDVLAGAFT